MVLGIITLLACSDHSITKMDVDREHRTCTATVKFEGDQLYSGTQTFTVEPFYESKGLDSYYNLGLELRLACGAFFDKKLAS